MIDLNIVGLSIAAGVGDALNPCVFLSLAAFSWFIYPHQKNANLYFVLYFLSLLFGFCYFNISLFLQPIWYKWGFWFQRVVDVVAGLFALYAGVISFRKWLTRQEIGGETGWVPEQWSFLIKYIVITLLAFIMVLISEQWPLDQFVGMMLNTWIVLKQSDNVLSCLMGYAFGFYIPVLLGWLIWLLSARRYQRPLLAMIYLPAAVVIWLGLRW